MLDPLFLSCGILALFVGLMFLLFRAYRKRAIQQVVYSLQTVFEYPWVIVDKKNRVICANVAFQEKFLKNFFKERKIQEVCFKDSFSDVKKGLVQVLKDDIFLPQSVTFDVQCSSLQKLRVRICSLLKTELKWISIEELTPIQLAAISHKDFIANASHELRTPITIIKGFIETLMDMSEVSEAMLEDVFDKVLRSCQRMESTIKNLMILINLDQTCEMKVKTVDIVTLFESCFHTLKTIHPELQYMIKSSQAQVNFDVDADLLELALMNLLQNAIKYSRGIPEILVECEKEKDHLIVKISDRGIGIPQDKKEQIFERFYTVDKAISKKLGGVGLGLSIVKSAIEKHQGTVEGYPREGGGSTFCIKLPVLA